MSTRERWTVYPLVFLSLFMAARDKLVPREKVAFRTLECQQLVVTNINDEKLISMGETDDAGVVIVYGPPGRLDRIAGRRRNLDPSDTHPPQSGPTVAKPASANLRLEPSPRVEISADQGGGFIRVLSNSDAPTLQLGHDAAHQLSGLMGLEEHDQLTQGGGTQPTELWGTLYRWPTAPTSKVDSAADQSEEK